MSSDVLYQAEAAHVVKLSALRVEAATGVGVVRVERGDHLHDRQVIVVKLHRVEQDVILHRWTAETGIVGDAGNALIGALDDPVFEGVQLHRRAVGTLDHVAIDQAAGAEQRRHAGSDALRERGVADALENNCRAK